MAIRKIIKIDENRCNGCGLCIPNCAEGALRIIDGKAKVVKDSYCDGLGACLGHCPQGALEIVERDAEDFDIEEASKHAAGQLSAEVRHSKVIPQQGSSVHSHATGGCPGSRMRMLNTQNNTAASAVSSGDIEIKIKPQLGQWPVQLNLVPVKAPFFENADLLVTADCVPYAFANYHLELLKGKAVAVGCPKLDDIEHYADKLTDILANNSIKSITVAFMEVPCCSGIVRAVEYAAANSGKEIPIIKVRIGIDGSKELV